MRNLFRFIARNYFVFLFLLLEGTGFLLIVQYNSYQRSRVIKHSRGIGMFLSSNVMGFNQYFHLRTENEVLSAENARLRNLLEKERSRYYTMDTSRNIQPGFMENDSAYADSGRVIYEFIHARVVNNSVNRQNNLITIDKGSRQGVYPEMAVISDYGVVGIVVRTSNNFSRVLPVLNRNFRLSAKIKKNNNFGIIEWDGISAEYAPLKEVPVHVDIQIGDTIVTSGYSAIFPEGLNIGIVEKVSPTDGNFSDVRIKLLTNFRNLVHVYLVKYNYLDEHKSIEAENEEK